MPFIFSQNSLTRLKSASAFSFKHIAGVRQTFLIFSAADFLLQLLRQDKLTQVADSIAGTITRTYDALNRLISEMTPQGSVSYTYDAAGRRTSMTVLGQPTVDYTYDDANRLIQITQGAAIVSFTYDNGGRRTSLTLPNGVLVEYAYDNASRVTSITYKENGTIVLGDLTYEYDKNGSRTKIGGSFARTGIPQPIASTAYNAANHQTTFGDKTLTYDNNGNLQTITDATGTMTYTWNARNQLVGISGPGVSASFVYDGLGRREKKTINASLTEFLFDGVNPVQETSGAAVLANILSGLSIDEFLTRTDVAAGTTSSLLTDHVGSVLALADSVGTIQTEYTYEPFGRVTATGASNTNPFQFTGRENDGTGLYYYRARYYHPGLQRFISEDPIGKPAFLACPSQRDMLLRLVTSPAGSAIEMINLYPYVKNNPVIFRDPTGLLSMSCWNNLICNVVYAVACYIVCSPLTIPTGGAPNPASITCDLICYGITNQVCQQQYPCPPPNSKSG